MGMNKLVKSITLANIHNVIHKNFDGWARNFNTMGKGEKFFAFNAMRVLHLGPPL